MPLLQHVVTVTYRISYSTHTHIRQDALLAYSIGCWWHTRLAHRYIDPLWWQGR